MLQCAHFKSCHMRFLCQNKDFVRSCKLCYDTKLGIRQCSLICPDYQETIFPKLQKAPYVCNGCLKFRRCDLQHALYSPQQADESSHDLLVSCRDGINQSPADIALLDELISPLLKQGNHSLIFMLIMVMKSLAAGGLFTIILTGEFLLPKILI